MLLKKKTAAPAADRIVVPSLSDASPEYAALTAKRADLAGLASKLDDERVDIIFKLDNGAARNVNEARIAELLGDDDAVPLKSTLRERLTEIATETGSLTKALAILDERVRTARAAASREICSSVRGEYLARISAVVAALDAAAQATGSLHDLLNDLEAADVAWTGHLPPYRLYWLVERAKQVTKTMREEGVIAEIPEALK